MYDLVETGIINDCEGEFTMHRKKVIAGLCALLVIAGLMSCGKRGDPYRPSESPSQQANS